MVAPLAGAERPSNRARVLEPWVWGGGVVSGTALESTSPPLRLEELLLGKET